MSNYNPVSISSIFAILVADLNITITEESYLLTLNLLFQSLGNLFWIPLSEKTGKRPVIIACPALFFVSTIADICFLHERGL